MIGKYENGFYRVTICKCCKIDLMNIPFVTGLPDIQWGEQLLLLKVINKRTGYQLTKYCPTSLYGNNDLEHTLVLKQDSFLLVLDDVWAEFDCQTLNIIHFKKVDIFGTIFAIYPYHDDYIMYGELSILRVNPYLDVVWEVGGRDIFVRKDNGVSFRFTQTKICVCDWMNCYYEWDCQGNLLTERVNCTDKELDCLLELSADL